MNISNKINSYIIKNKKMIVVLYLNQPYPSTNHTCLEVFCSLSFSPFSFWSDSVVVVSPLDLLVWRNLSVERLTGIKPTLGCSGKAAERVLLLLWNKLRYLEGCK